MVDIDPVNKDETSRKPKKQRKQYASIPSSAQEEYDHMLNSFGDAGNDIRPVCPLGHKCFRYMPINKCRDSTDESESKIAISTNECEKYYDTSFTCNKCGCSYSGGKYQEQSTSSNHDNESISSNSGGRWSCVICHCYDTCFECCSPSSAISTKSEIGAISFARRHLAVAGRRETDGIPVGALLVPKQFAGDIRRDWSETGLESHAGITATVTASASAIGPLGKIGFKKVQEVPGDSRYFILVLSTNSAQLISAGVLAMTGSGSGTETVSNIIEIETVSDSGCKPVEENLLPALPLAPSTPPSSPPPGELSSAQEIALVVEFLTAHPYAEYYPGVRLFDPLLLSRGTPSSSEYRNNRVSRSDNKKEFGFVRVVDNNALTTSSTTADIQKLTDHNRFQFAEIFAGIGGFRLGLDAIGGRCVFAAEINEDARHTYILNFPEKGEEKKGQEMKKCKEVGTVDGTGAGSRGNNNKNKLRGSVMHHDVTEHYGSDMPPFDMLTAGFPCQSFSNRGEQKGLDDPRGQLYLELLRLLRARQPASFLFENVSRLVTIDGGRRSKPHESLDKCEIGATFAMMLRQFAACGYAVTWHILNSRHWLPQMRERVYIVGIRGDLVARDPQARDITDLFRWENVQVRAGDRIQSTVRQILQTPEEFLTPVTYHNTFTGETIQYTPECILTPAQWARVSSSEFEQKSNRYPGRCPEGQERLINLEGKTPTLNSGYRNVASFSTKYIGEEKDGTVRELPRFLTPRECCRIQGFPESFEIPLANLAQLGRFYVQIGNAVCPPVIQSIGEQMLELLEILKFRE